jgi:hypothetical protein
MKRWSNGVMHLAHPTFDFGTWWVAGPERARRIDFFDPLASEILLSSHYSFDSLANGLVFELRSGRHQAENEGGRPFSSSRHK